MTGLYGGEQQISMKAIAKSIKKTDKRVKKLSKQMSLGTKAMMAGSFLGGSTWLPVVAILFVIGFITLSIVLVSISPGASTTVQAVSWIMFSISILMVLGGALVGIIYCYKTNSVSYKSDNEQGEMKSKKKKCESDESDSDYD